MSVQNSEWESFFEGKWTRKLPTVIGEYPCRTLGGDPAGTIHVIRHKVTGAFFTAPHTPTTFVGTRWGGWFWTKPLPKDYGLPPIPVDEQ